MYALNVIFFDNENEEFLDLGFARWNTREQQLEQWNAIPAAPDGTTGFVLDKQDADSDPSNMEDTKCITAEQVECLLGEPVAVLIERARQKSADFYAQKGMTLDKMSHSVDSSDSAARFGVDTGISILVERLRRYEGVLEGNSGGEAGSDEAREVLEDRRS